MSSKKLYSRNLSVAVETARLLKECRIIKFKTQSRLHCFIEDIKNPFLKRYRINSSKPYATRYSAFHNYDPIVNHLENAGVITSVRTNPENQTAPIEYIVNELNLNNYLNS
jgi:hypothetical protein